MRLNPQELHELMTDLAYT